MPNFVVMRVTDIPAVNQSVQGEISVQNAVDEPTAVQQALAMWNERTPGVVGVTLASNIVRRTYTTPPPVYTVT
jgi:hypothetical protein